MARINIAGTEFIDDFEYRYKMPRLVSKIEGKGNGIKTVIPNCLDVANALHRSVEEICKYFGYHFNSQSRCKNNQVIVNGVFSTFDLQDALSLYIEKFVLCSCCRLPETKYKIRKQRVYHSCDACGARNEIDHKLNKIILKLHK